jgi:hypothetical protein
MFLECEYHYLQHISLHPQKGTVQPKIVDTDRDANSPKAEPRSAESSVPRRKLQVNSVVEVYFYHKEDVPSEDEQPLPKKQKKKNNPEAEAIQIKELEELR